MRFIFGQPKSPVSSVSTDRSVETQSVHIPPPAAMDRHVDIDALIEDYAWNYFKDMLSLRKASGLDTFKSLDRADVEFVVVSSCTNFGYNVGRRDTVCVFPVLIEKQENF